ncbi:MAG: cysteine methyltransferase [Proteobacteria bacterium]|nr:MAG: cysteine methyltransferase [Pseudomonadota bacterium]
MKRINISYHKSEIGEFIIGTYDEQLCIMDFRYRKTRAKLNEKIKKSLEAEFIECEDELIQKAKKQLDEYLLGKRKEFSLPLLLVGSEFQKQVWNALLDVHYGQTASYKELAKNIEKPEAVRAVANANGANSLAIIVPCHRIIASDGELGGYSGGVSVKKKLLKLELGG